MANNNLPAHDFAPPWLKIPSYDCHKPPLGDYPNSHTSRRDEHCLIRHNREDDFSPRYLLDSRRDRDSHSGDRKGSFFPSRHSSIDIEDGSIFQPGHLSKSQPSLLRRPSSRHDFRGDHTNSYSKGGAFIEVNSNGSPYGVTSKGSKGHVGSHIDVIPRINGTSEGSNGIDVTSNNFNQEFPSLKGCDEAISDQTTPGLNGSVWENPFNAKVHGVSHKMQVFQRPIKDPVKETRSRSPFGGPACNSPKPNSTNSTSCVNNKSVNILSQPATAIYRALIPAKSTHSKKMGKDVSRPSTKRQTPPLPTSSLVGPPATQNMEILVKNPRMRGCNKSHFLKTLRGEGETAASQQPQDSASSDHTTDGTTSPVGEATVEPLKCEALMNGNTFLGEEDDEEDSQSMERPVEHNQKHLCENGIEIITPENNEDHHMLSSSLEAEQRLLKEMGWKEDGSDDDAYAPLTEDELQEFKDLALKMAEKKNGLNTSQAGHAISSLQSLHPQKMNWSPKRVPPFAPLVLPPNEEEGSWSSTSDSD